MTGTTGHFPGLTAEEDVAGRSHQHPGDAGQRADEAENPAKHQQHQAEGQHDHHHLVQTWEQAVRFSVCCFVNVDSCATFISHREGASPPPIGRTRPPGRKQ